MLTFLHPESLCAIKEMPFGILPLFFEGEEFPILVVKATKETILAAKINYGFKVYIAPSLISGQFTAGLISAFFDDVDEPLTITTPLFDDDFSFDIIKLLLAHRVCIHFFDELSREQLVYHATVSLHDETKWQLEKLVLVGFSLPIARKILDDASIWFGLRTAEDDEKAIDISLNESVYGEGFFIQDLRQEKHLFHGSQGFSHTVLERKEPGSYQEEDIIQCLLSVFPAEEIFFSPKRTYDNEEMCDILIITNSRVLIIQAKDSPNIERISRQTINRKKSNGISSLKKAIAQVKGAIKYFNKENGLLEFLIDGKLHQIRTDGLCVHTLIVVKELFDDMYDEYSPLLIDLIQEKSSPCIALDYPELYRYCLYTKNEESFFNAYNVVLNHAVTHGVYPRLRFGLTDLNE